VVVEGRKIMKKKTKRLKIPPTLEFDPKRAHKEKDTFLKLLFEHEGLSIEAIAKALGISEGMTRYHADVLSASGMITTMGFDVGWPGLPKHRLLPKGREYVVELARQNCDRFVSDG
jgi:predicted ArsR family transcriptional regulator